ncbi:DUF6412 domain-containing protein [Microbacterium sp. HJ5]
MSESIGAVLRLLLDVLGVAAIREPSAIALAAAAVAAVAVVVLALSQVELPVSSVGSSPHPQRAIDVSVRLTQSDPDAAGHPRPRAPGSAALAA